MVFEAAVGIDKADFFPVLGLVDGSKILETQLTALVFRFPDGGGGSIAKKAEADEDAGLVVEVKGG